MDGNTELSNMLLVKRNGNEKQPALLLGKTTSRMTTKELICLIDIMEVK